MTRKSALGAAMLMAWLVLPAGAQERTRTVPTRAFDRFEFESETGVGLWAEAGALYERQQNQDVPANGTTASLQLHSVTSFARFAYGGDKWEAGAFVPYLDVSGDLKHMGRTLDLDENGIGDVQLSGKYIPIRSDFLDFGAGLDVSVPSGDYTRGLGAGEPGAIPFVTGALHMAVVDVRAHVGGEFFYGSSHHGLASDQLVYGFGIFAPLGNYVALRNEFSAVDPYDIEKGPKVVNYLPGLDFRLPIGNLDALLRITGAYGISAAAPIWGAGGSIVISSPTYRVPPSKTGGVVVE